MSALIGVCPSALSKKKPGLCPLPNGHKLSICVTLVCNRVAGAGTPMSNANSASPYNSDG